eukprot:gnl/TRDRNA2_/TRDRNA2_209826_c0_seq1.p1 gnl/TRDRNA2_/TRDRNA2_209826_c0~~gnl/TRDRNA2_/TRDRNA2_209826_c0_seq1.p1  ORF type:complete len:130 (+),score=12.07 gnl/TRDRNA2_/TRDRNA2_209826_c0_seq1:129-518(+)
MARKEILPRMQTSAWGYEEAKHDPRWQLFTPHRKQLGKYVQNQTKPTLSHNGSCPRRIASTLASSNGVHRKSKGKLTAQNNIAHAIEACAEKKNHQEQSSLWLMGTSNMSRTRATTIAQWTRHLTPALP